MMFDIIEFPTGGYGIKSKAKFNIDVKGKKWQTLFLYSFTDNEFKDLNLMKQTKGDCIVPIEFKHASFNYVISCINELNCRFKDPLAEEKFPV